MTEILLTHLRTIIVLEKSDFKLINILKLQMLADESNQEYYM